MKQREIKKNATACVLAVVLSLTCAAYPVNAEDMLLAQQKEQVSLQVDTIESGPIIIGDECGDECDGHRITGNSTSNNITVTSGTHNITLVECSIELSGNTAFSIKKDATVNLTLERNNILKGGDNYAGLNVSRYGTLIITEESVGSLSATGGKYGAGIGANRGTGGTITINGGNVTATGGRYGAGIGGGYSGNGGTITINGGTITAYKGFDAYAIGAGGYMHSSGAITINNGSVKAHNITGTPTNRTENVYLAKLENLSGIDSVIVDNTVTYTRNGNHYDNDGTFYLYLTGKDHTIKTSQGEYKVIWNEKNSCFMENAPIPTVTTATTTASSITVNPLENADTYGGAEYSMDNQNWQDSNVFEMLSANNVYTVYARYKGNDTYIQSEVGIVEVSTAPATYEITIPMTIAADDSENTIGIEDTDNFDLGYNGKVNVKIKDTGVIKDSTLTLTRENGKGETVTSQLLVDGNSFTDLTLNVTTFSNKADAAISFVFKRPTNSNILAGTYKGTIVFDISYSED